jgi:hypothetical protein
MLDASHIITKVFTSYSSGFSTSVFLTVAFVPLLLVLWIL